MTSLALGVVGGAGRPGPGRVVARSAEGVVDLAPLADVEGGPHPDLLAAPTLDALLAAGRPAWREVHGWLAERLRAPHAPYVLPRSGWSCGCRSPWPTTSTSSAASSTPATRG